MDSKGFFVRCLAIVLIFALSFQSLHSINSHSYNIGFNNCHLIQTEGIIFCFGGQFGIVHSVYNCGQIFHIN